MITKSVALLCCLSIVHSATIQQKTIPVEIRYDGAQITSKELRGAAEEAVVENAVRNLDEKVQLSPEELSESLKHLPVPEELEEKPVENAVKNLDAKVQLSPEELSQSLKHLPVQEEPAEKPEEIQAVPEEAPQKEQQETPQEQSQAQKNVEIFPEAVGTKSSAGSLERLQSLRDIVVTELRSLRDSLKTKTGQFFPNNEQWDELESSIGRVYEETKNTLLVKQAQLPEPAVGEPTKPTAQQPAQGGSGGGGGNVFQNFFNGIYGSMQNFVQNIQQQGSRPQGAQGDAGTAAQPTNPGFVGFIQQGFTNIYNSLTNAGQVQGGPSTSNTVLGDTGTPVQSPPQGNPVSNFFGGVVTNVQSIFGGGNNGSPAGTQGDTGVTPANTNQQGPVQFVNAIGNSISSFFQGGNRPAGTSGDEGTQQPAAGGSNGPAAIFQNIGNVIQNSPFNPFRPQQNAGTGPQNLIQQGIQSTSNQIQQAVTNFQGQINPQPGASSEAGSSPSPPPPVVEVPDGQRKPVAENTASTKKPEKVEKDNEIVQKVEQKEEIMTTVE